MVWSFTMGCMSLVEKQTSYYPVVSYLEEHCLADGGQTVVYCRSKV